MRRFILLQKARSITGGSSHGIMNSDDTESLLSVYENKSKLDAKSAIRCKKCR